MPRTIMERATKDFGFSNLVATPETTQEMQMRITETVNQLKGGDKSAVLMLLTQIQNRQAIKMARLADLIEGLNEVKEGALI